ncbi:hypothetical protein OE88DRAFT_1811078 [Heliocybe sulcata]|uniref:Protein kinase domain-containing protein n=1 Tax=Heliocybe sulcata TaxID=5364 RepID=A0A5C3MRQ9_9AGAM|nr:hypothetical protein OE88DRAFT_1811078 [Heliocybe sulcata]
MKIKVSPEQFLRIAVPPNLPHGFPEVASTSDHAADNSPSLDIRATIWQYGRLSSFASGFTRALKEHRFSTVEIDTELPRASDSVVAKYIEPVLDYANREFFDIGTPRLEAVLHTTAEGDPMQIFLLAMNTSAEGAEDREWAEPVSKVDLSLEKKCFCVFISLAPGSIRLADFPETGGRPFTSTPLVERAVYHLIDICDETCAPFGIITDELAVVGLNHHPKLRGDSVGSSHSFQALPVSETPVRMALAYLLSFEALAIGHRRFGGDHFSPCLGCLYNPREEHLLPKRDDQGRNIPPPPPPPFLPLENRRSFEDFDFYTMQRDPKEWQGFLQWKQTMENDALLHALRPGQMVSICVDFFRDRYSCHRRSPLYTLPPVPDETMNIVTEITRPRSSTVDQMLRRHKLKTVAFEVTHVVQAGWGKYSQVFFGRLSGTTQQLCLKVYDERLFHVDKETNFFDKRPELRLQYLNYAVDLVRREEAVYDCLQDMQGSLIPHCYGFHQVTLPDGSQWLAVLLEVIDAPDLSEAGLTELSITAQRDFVTRLRHAVRAIRYRGIVQTDWHLAQVYCPKIPGDEEGRLSVVLLDFAFALQHLGDSTAVRINIGFLPIEYYVQFGLRVNKQIMDECWFPYVEAEY